MPKFFFSVHGDHPLEEGVELASVAEAKITAVRYAARLLSDSATAFWASGHFRLSVADEIGLTLFTLEIVGTDAPSIRVQMPHQI